MKSESPRVLVVDDCEGIRLALSAIVSLLGFQVAQASNGFEAMALFLQQGFELILTDLHMPGMDGWTLASAIKGKSPGTPVILITGSAPENVKTRSAQGCVDRVIFKPFRAQDVEHAVLSLAGPKTGWTGREGQSAAQA
jgi:two-component system, NarL family, capsular synthesis sensor histidine kinase RcsC